LFRVVVRQREPKPGGERQLAMMNAARDSPEH
jgi:hypothetical protein